MEFSAPPRSVSFFRIQNSLTNLQILDSHVEDVGNLHEGQSEFPDAIDEFAGSRSLFLVLFSD